MKTKPPSRFAGPVKAKRAKVHHVSQKNGQNDMQIKKKRKRENPFLSPKALLIILFTSISILSVFEKIYEVKDLKITL